MTQNQSLIHISILNIVTWHFQGVFDDIQKTFMVWTYQQKPQSCEPGIHDAVQSALDWCIFPKQNEKCVLKKLM
jgi:hypothetical protein